MQARVAERLQISRATVSKWVHRYRVEGLTGLTDRSSTPHFSPTQTATRTQRRIGYHLRLPQSTVSKVLHRYEMPLLGHIDLNTGLAVGKPKPIRYEHPQLGRYGACGREETWPHPGRWWLANIGSHRGTEEQEKGCPIGYAFLHSTIEDNSRVVCSEILAEEKAVTAAGFWHRANSYYEPLGITVKRVLSDNGSCYRSQLFNDALGEAAHKYTRPYR